MADEIVTDNQRTELRSELRKHETNQFTLLSERLSALGQTPIESNLMANKAAPATTASSYSEIRHRLHKGLIDVLNPQAVSVASLEQIEAAVKDYVNNSLEQETLPLSRNERNRLVEDLMYEVMGLGPLSPLMTDRTISDILVNGAHQIYVEKHGLLELTDIHFHDDDHLMLTIERILSRVGRRVDESSPMADARLADGSRVNVIIPPLAIRGPTMSIRRFMRNILDVNELVAGGSMTYEAAEFLKYAVQAQLNIVVSGGTGSGKTTMLNCLSQYIGDGERIVVIEDTSELQLNQRHVVQLEARPANTEGLGAVSIRDLVKNSLRMRPDRIVVGEVRGSEALDMLQAMNTGHDGSLATLHSNSPRDTLARLETMMLMAELDLPQRVLREQIASAVHLIVHVNRFADGSRRVANITEITGLEEGTVLMQDIFVTKREGEEMVMRSSGIVPNVLKLMHERGFEVSHDLF